MSNLLKMVVFKSASTIKPSAQIISYESQYDVHGVWWPDINNCCRHTSLNMPFFKLMNCLPTIYPTLFQLRYQVRTPSYLRGEAPLFTQARDDVGVALILRLLRAFLDGKDRDGGAWGTGRPHRAPDLGRCPDDDGKDAERGEAADGDLRTEARRDYCRRGTFGRKARLHPLAAVVGTVAVDEYATIGRKARLHPPAVGAVAVNKCVTGRKAQ